MLAMERSGAARPVGDDRLRLFLDELPPHLRPTPEARVLQVALVWGDDQLLDVQEIRPGATFTLGSTTAASMQVHHEATRAGAFPLLRPDGEAFTIFLPASARSRMTTGGEDLSIVDLVERDLARMIHVPISGAELRLGLHDRVTLHFGNLRLFVRYVRPVAKRAASPYDAGFWTRVTIYVMAAITLAAMSAVEPPPDDAAFEGVRMAYVRGE